VNPAELPRTGETVKPAGRPGTGEPILVVDDEDSSRRLVKAISKRRATR